MPQMLIPNYSDDDDDFSCEKVNKKMRMAINSCHCMLPFSVCNCLKNLHLLC